MQADVNRGAAEDASGVPLTETEEEVSQRPPSQPADRGDDGGRIEALEDRPEVQAAIEDDTTAPGLGDDEASQRF